MILVEAFLFGFKTAAVLFAGLAGAALFLAAIIGLFLFLLNLLDWIKSQRKGGPVHE